MARTAAVELPSANRYRGFLPDFERLGDANADNRHEPGIANIDRDEPGLISLEWFEMPVLLAYLGI